MKRIGLLFSIFLMVAILITCAPKSVIVEKPETKPTLVEQPKAPAKESWEIKWDETLQLAKKEGNLVIYSFSGPEFTQPLSQALREKLGLNSEMLTMRGPEMAEKIMREKRAGLHLVDLAISGAGTFLTVLKPAGLLESVEPELFLPEVREPKFWWQGKLPFYDKEGLVFGFRADVNTVILLNREMAKKEDLKSYKDLLNPKWKRAILLDDPTARGPGFFFFRIIGLEYMDLDFLRGLAKQEPTLTRDRRHLVEWVARSKFAIGLGAQASMVRSFQQLGSPLEQFNPKEGGYITGGAGNIVIFKNPPRPNSRRVFLNWFLSKEGQTFFSRSQEQGSTRVDVPVDHLSADLVRQPGMPYFSTLLEEWHLKGDKDAKLAEEIFGHLMK